MVERSSAPWQTQCPQVGEGAAIRSSWVRVSPNRPASGGVRPLAGSDVTARFTESGVEVTITVTTTRVTALLRPIRPGFHVHNIDLPADGIDGRGVATGLSVARGLTATGPATVDRAVRLLDLPALWAKFPVCPDGPVKILCGRGVPVVRLTSSCRTACSRGSCLAPVTGHVTRIAVH